MEEKVDHDDGGGGGGKDAGNDGNDYDDVGINKPRRKKIYKCVKKKHQLVPIRQDSTDNNTAANVTKCSRVMSLCHVTKRET